VDFLSILEHDRVGLALPQARSKALAGRVGKIYFAHALSEKAIAQRFLNFAF